MIIQTSRKHHKTVMIEEYDVGLPDGVFRQFEIMTNDQHQRLLGVVSLSTEGEYYHSYGTGNNVTLWAAIKSLLKAREVQAHYDELCIACKTLLKAREVQGK